MPVCGWLGAYMAGCMMLWLCDWLGVWLDGAYIGWLYDCLAPMRLISYGTGGYANG